MAEGTGDVEVSVPHSHCQDDTTGSALSQSQGESHLNVEVDKQGKRYIMVSCGEERGRLYLEKLGKLKGSKSWGKCIVTKDKTITPKNLSFWLARKRKHGEVNKT